MLRFGVLRRLAAAPTVPIVVVVAARQQSEAEAHAAARKFDTVNYLGLRLAPDMLPFASQIRITSDTAKGCVARLSGQEPPKFEDNETTLDDHVLLLT